MSEYWIPPDEEWVHARARWEMRDYKPPEITAEMIGIYAGHDPDPLNLIGNPHRVTAAQVSSFTQEEQDERGSDHSPDQAGARVPEPGQLGDV